MKQRIAAAGLLACGLALAGCASAPIAYYTLMPSTTATQAQPPADPVRIEVLPVALPEMLDRPQMVVRQGEAGVSVLDRVRWASPLSDELRAALSAAWVPPADAAGLPLWRVQVEVRRLDAHPGQQVRLEADWTARAVGDTRLRLVCHSRIAQPAPADYPGLAVAHQAAVQQLAQDIDRAVRRKAC